MTTPSPAGPATGAATGAAIGVATAPPAVELDVFGCALDGVNVIEASAGTGKTWNLCGLYLRLLLERGLEVQRILVVTFTNAATAELRERIRERIVRTAEHLRGLGATGPDTFVTRLVRTLRERCALGDDVLLGRLDAALATFDEAAIFTIHGFCQRALADAPFAAQLPFVMELVQDDRELVQQAANDFWRRAVAADTLDPALGAYLDRRGDSPEKLARVLERHLAKPTATCLWPAAIDQAPALDAAALQAAHDQARAIWTTRREEILQCVKDALADLRANIYTWDSVTTAGEGWDQLLTEADARSALALAPEKVDLLRLDRLQSSTKKGHTTPEHPFFGLAQELLEKRADLEQSLRLARLQLIRRLLDEAPEALRRAKRQRRVLSFDDMLFNLHERLTGGDAPWLAASLRARFPAALIDEFQDTDPLQFSIFRAVYGDGAQPLFLVGDPKQAIYSFRHADLHTYLQARRHARAEYTLSANQRSAEPLLEALNALFGANPQAFMLPGLAYRRVEFGQKERAPFVDRGEARAALQVWMLPRAPGDGTPVPKKEAMDAAMRACAGEIARLLSAARRGEVTLGERALRAGDLAVLVRSHAEGARARQALAALGVGSVELSRATVFASPDAEDLDRLLCAVLEPARERLLKAALATEAMGLDAAGVAAVGGDEARLLEVVQRFAAYRDTWLERGVGVMLRRWLAEERVAARMLARPDGERRLTNLLHLVELLHAAAESHPAPDALLRWFQGQRRERREDDAIQLRLESDQNLVQIVTIHKSKGLEYPVVFCPFLANGRAGRMGDALDGVEYHDDAGRAVVDFRKDFAGEFDEPGVKRRRKLEADAESLRLVYVALTRAVHRCVIVAGSYLAKAGARASPTESARSLLNWLVAGGGLSPEAWFASRKDTGEIEAAWNTLASRCAPHLGIAPLPQGPWAPLAGERVAPEMLAPLPAPARIPSGWWVGSYSALKHGASPEAAAADHDLRAAAPEPPAARALPVEPDDVLRFARGASAGECIHAVFERADFGDPATWPGAVASALQQFAPTLEPEAGAAAGRDAQLDGRRLQRMLADVVHTPLAVGTTRALVLRDVPLRRRLTELEFHLPAQGLEARALDAALQRFGYDVPRLAFATLRGFLKGYVDLVLEHEGRTFVVDWKSNLLGETPPDYARGRLEAVMAAQGYHLQYLLYSVALERHLRRRIGGYRHADHFGGVIYLFVRGVRPHWTDGDGAPTGVFFHRPSAEVLEALSSLLGPPGADARHRSSGALA